MNRKLPGTKTEFRCPAFLVGAGVRGRKGMDGVYNGFLATCRAQLPAPLPACPKWLRPDGRVIMASNSPAPSFLLQVSLSLFLNQDLPSPRTKRFPSR